MKGHRGLTKARQIVIISVRGSYFNHLLLSAFCLSALCWEKIIRLFNPADSESIKCIGLESQCSLAKLKMHSPDLSSEKNLQIIPQLMHPCF